MGAESLADDLMLGARSLLKQRASEGGEGGVLLAEGRTGRSVGVCFRE